MLKQVKPNGEYVDKHGEKRNWYGTVRWTTGDLQTLFDLTDDEAHEWLQNNEKHIQNRLVELGWEVLEDLGKMDDLPPLKECD